MKETRSLLMKRWLGCGLVLAVASAVAAPAPDQDQGVATVVRLKGAARYAAGSNAGKLLKVGDHVKAGNVIQTAADSRVDLVLGDGSTPLARPVAGEMMSWQPAADQNIVRLWGNTLLGIDKLGMKQTGAEEETDTQLDLKAGHIFGMVKKLSGASKYEVKIPNGVAGIRGTVYDIRAEGIVKVLSGSVVLAFVGPDGTVVTQVIMGDQEFDAPSNTLKPLSDLDKSGLDQWRRDCPPRPPPGPRPRPTPPPWKPPSRWTPPGPPPFPPGPPGDK